MPSKTRRISTTDNNYIIKRLQKMVTDYSQSTLSHGIGVPRHTQGTAQHQLSYTAGGSYDYRTAGLKIIVPQDLIIIFNGKQRELWGHRGREGEWGGNQGSYGTAILRNGPLV